MGEGALAQAGAGSSELAVFKAIRRGSTQAFRKLRFDAQRIAGPRSRDPLSTIRVVSSREREAHPENAGVVNRVACRPDPRDQADTRQTLPPARTTGT